MSSQKKNIIIPEKEKRAEIFRNSKINQHLDVNSISAAVAIMEMAEKIHNAVNSHFTRYNLTQARFIVMLTMYSSGAASHSPVELASAIGVRPPTMTGILDGLVKEGFVSRKSDNADRRKVMVSLTAKGKKKIQSVLPDHFKRISAAFANLQEKSNNKQLLFVLSELDKSLAMLQEGLS